MIATITDYYGKSRTGQIKCWMGRRVVEVETPDGCRHIGRWHRDTDTPARRPS